MLNVLIGCEESGVVRDAFIEGVCLENPVGMLTPFLGKAQYIQPYEFGHNASKKTGLWLHNLPNLIKNPDFYVKPRIVNGLPRWANQTDSGQNKLAPSSPRKRDRSETYLGIAHAMAEQWGKITSTLK